MTNLAKRIIPCLDIQDGRVVKGINFVGLKDAGNPIEIAKRYNDAGADELIFLDINATHEARKTTLHVIESIAKKVFIPLTVGGGISTLQDISNLLDAGCDKVSLNSSALKNPSFIDEAAKTFGSQCVVIAIDAKLRKDGSIGVFTHGGRQDSTKNMQDWLIEVENRGAGEILLTSMDTDGTKNGFDIDVHYAGNEAKAKETADEIKALGRNAEILKFDIKNREECASVLEGKLYYGIVLNAGIARDNVFPALEGDEWDEVISTNLTGFYNVLKPLVMPMISNRIKGRIIAMSSVAALSGNRGQVNYSASKAGIIGAVKSLALELAKRGITVNCIAPGVINTDMIKDVPLDEVKKLIPMKRLGEAKEVASLVNYLMSEDASYITGQVISVNGGLYL